MKKSHPFYLPPGFFVDKGVRYGDEGVWVCPHPVQILHIAKHHVCENGKLVAKKLIIHRAADTPTAVYAWLASEVLSEEYWQSAHEGCPYLFPRPDLIVWYFRGLVVEFIRRQRCEK